jgi:hypothetical protein
MLLEELVENVKSVLDVLGLVLELERSLSAIHIVEYDKFLIQTSLGSFRGFPLPSGFGTTISAMLCDFGVGIGIFRLTMAFGGASQVGTQEG